MLVTARSRSTDTESFLARYRYMWERNKKFRKPDDLCSPTRSGKPLDRHNLLHRHLKKAAEKLGLPDDDRLPQLPYHAREPDAAYGRPSWRSPATTWVTRGAPAPSRWMSIRRSWWDERVDAVTRVVEAVFTEPEEKRRE